jgi:signal transduction histidine kinase
MDGEPICQPIPTDESNPPILVVDDNPVNLAILSEALAGIGLPVAIATDGESAIAQAESTVPELILLDVMLPGIDGFETCHHLKENPLTGDIPVIFMTALSDAANKVRGLSLGAVDYIAKPFQQEEVIARVRLHLRLSALNRELKQEIAERKRIETALRQTNRQLEEEIRLARLYRAARRQVEELEQLNRLKDDFLSTVSHELRTPVSNMKMAIHMLKLASQEEQKRHYLHILETECTREVDLINNLLDLQHLEAGSMRIETTSIHLQSWLPVLAQTLQPRAQRREQHLTVTADSALLDLQSDPQYLQRILVELATNACKYSPPGARIRIQARPGVGDSIVISVSNSGAGIPAPELNRIFEKFYRIPMSDLWRQGGTGLGLALVKQLIERLGGTISARSRNNNTTFSVKLPRDRQQLASTVRDRPRVSEGPLTTDEWQTSC